MLITSLSRTQLSKSVPAHLIQSKSKRAKKKAKDKVITSLYMPQGASEWKLEKKAPVTTPS
jgi:hypothetical protein